MCEVYVKCMPLSEVCGLVFGVGFWFGECFDNRY